MSQKYWLLLSSHLSSILPERAWSRASNMSMPNIQEQLDFCCPNFSLQTYLLLDGTLMRSMRTMCLRHDNSEAILYRCASRHKFCRSECFSAFGEHRDILFLVPPRNPSSGHPGIACLRGCVTKTALTTHRSLCIFWCFTRTEFHLTLALAG